MIRGRGSSCASLSPLPALSRGVVLIRPERKSCLRGPRTRSAQRGSLECQTGIQKGNRIPCRFCLRHPRRQQRSAAIWQFAGDDWEFTNSDSDPFLGFRCSFCGLTWLDVERMLDKYNKITDTNKSGETISNAKPF